MSQREELSFAGLPSRDCLGTAVCPSLGFLDVCCILRANGCHWSDVLQGLCLDSRFKVYFHYAYVHVHAHEFACTMCMQRPEKGNRARELRFQVVHIPHGYWELNPGILHDQWTLLTMEPPLCLLD